MNNAEPCFQKDMPRFRDRTVDAVITFIQPRIEERPRTISRHAYLEFPHSQHSIPPTAK